MSGDGAASFSGDPKCYSLSLVFNGNLPLLSAVGPDLSCCLRGLGRPACSGMDGASHVFCWQLSPALCCANCCWTEELSGRGWGWRCPGTSAPARAPLPLAPGPQPSGPFPEGSRRSFLLPLPPSAFSTSVMVALWPSAPGLSCADLTSPVPSLPAVSPFRSSVVITVVL